jgi:hypothetical protein
MIFRWNNVWIQAKTHIFGACGKYFHRGHNMFNARMKMLWIVVLTLTIYPAGWADTIYVDCDATAGGNGESWGTAFQEIQTGISAAQNGDIVRVAPGVYNETIDFLGKAIEVTSVDPNNPSATIIDGDNNNGSVVTFENDEGSDSVLDGFTIRNGNTYYYGGGISCDNSPTIRKCIIEYCNASETGGGIAGGSPSLFDCVIRYNYADMGGGIAGYNIAMYNCSIYSNGVRYDDTLTLTGGGVAISGNSSVMLNCFVLDNAAWYGGGIYCGYNPVIKNCFVYANQAKYFGGGVYISDQATLKNCTVRSNSYSEHSGCGRGLYGDYDSDTTIVNSIFYDNGDPNAIGIDSGAELTVSYSDIQGGESEIYQDINSTLYWGTGNIDADPCLIDVCHIRHDSPCVDAGYNGVVDWSYDIDGQERVMPEEGVVDMGVDEVGPSVHNITLDTWYTTIQDAIDDADEAPTVNEIVAYPGTYVENIDFLRKPITLRSIDPQNWAVVDETIIDGDDSGTVVTFDSGEDTDSILEGFTITNGYTYDRGAGILCSGSSPTIQLCNIHDNYAVSRGGGICSYLDSNPTISHCIIHDNDVYERFGGGICVNGADAMVINCLLYGNTAPYGGGIYSDGILAMTNCTITTNIGPNDYSDGAYLSGTTAIKNCIFWGNNSRAGIYNDGTLTITYSDIQGGWTGTGNINSNPDFIDSNFYHLDSDSPCKNYGNDSGIDWDFDIDGEIRKNGTIDMGSDEVN